MVNIHKGNVSTSYRLVGDVPPGTIFKACGDVYLKGRGRSECECNVVNLATGQIDHMDVMVAIDCSYPEAGVLLGREDS